MEKRIELERRGKEPNQIVELNLDNCRTTTVEGLTDDYTRLESLSMIGCGLTSLKGFPKLPSLKKLELSDNRINQGLTNLQGCPNITHLNISGNRIKDLDVLEALKTFETLTHLDLFNNPINEEEDYRNKIFKLIPSLKYLDGTDVNDDEPEDSDDEEGDTNGYGGEEDDEDDDDDEDEDGEEEENDPALDSIYGTMPPFSDGLEGEEIEEVEDEDGEDEDVVDSEEEVEGDEEEEEEEEEESEEPAGKRRKTGKDAGEGGGEEDT